MHIQLLLRRCTSVIKTDEKFALLSLHCEGTKKDDKPTKQLSKRVTIATKKISSYGGRDDVL